MAAVCPGCRRDIDPFVAHFCGVREWSTPLTPTTSESLPPSSSECCGSSPSSSCPCRPTAPTTEPTAPSVASDDPKTTEPVSVSLDARYLTIHPDSRGNVRETFRASWFPEVPTIKQLVRSESVPKTLRGMHLHRRQWDLWHFVSGDAVVRLRWPDGEDRFIYADAGSTLAIPPGIAHGFYTEDGCILLYALTEEYDGTDEFGWYPFDGLTGESHPAWPTSHLGLVISERDLRATRLADFDW